MQKKDILAPIIILFALNLVFGGVEAEVLNHYVVAGENLSVFVSISEDFTGTADLKFCLAYFDFSALSYNYRCDLFLDRFDINIDHNYTGYYSFSLAGVQPLIYRLFVQLHFDDVYHKDSDSNNFIYLTSNGEQIVYIYNYSGVAIDARETRDYIEQGSTVSNCFNLTMYDNCSSISVYSFIHNNTLSVTGELNSNLQRLSIPYGSTARVCLNNTIRNDAPTGYYNYVIRVVSCVKDYDLAKNVLISSKSEPYYNLSITNSCLLLKNYDDAVINYSLFSINSTSSNNINGLVSGHTQKILFCGLNNTYIRLLLNDKPSLEQLFISNNTIIEYVMNSSSPSTAYMFKAENNEPSLYAISLLTSAAALIILYVKLR